MSNFKDVRIYNSGLKLDLESDDDTIIKDQIFLLSHKFNVISDIDQIQTKVKGIIKINKKTSIVSFILEPN